ncbi:D-alanyl-D-alanine carboxypeptidase [Myxacorys almedinensis A]|uniref:D-alanyl-D-alanine carboxypeptidase n=2 Tax=Myxacorys TaxID=2056239 RepID=A0A8J7YZ46_9CYAN|nr:D-alanyl-D-alanine carboxypeptidase [Myxacorys almedinensis]NDJ17242.1 D-alanyl-D-alanine carboxypeptidase [Myxacorys almedinensis A]
MAGVPPSLDPWQIAAQVDWSITPSTDAAAEAVIQHYLQNLVSQGLEPSSQGIWLQSGSTLLASHQGMTAMPAASLTKIATSLAALQTWGADHQFETPVSATGLIQNGELQGDLVVQASGDPMFVWEDAIALGNALNQIGITRVTGDLIITGRFMMNFDADPVQSGNALKMALDADQWDAAIAEEFAALPTETRRPKVAIAGAIRLGAPAASPTVLMRHRSLPLTDLLRYMNVQSDNEMSQLLTETMGGTQTMMQIATEAANLDPSEIQLVNGSGLGVDNRLSARAACALVAALDRVIHPHNLSLGDLFPVAGLEGVGTTLEDRSLPAQSVVKTGTLNEVSALAGVLPTRDRGLVQFAILNRGTEISSLRKQQDVLLQTLQQQWGKATADQVQPSKWVTARRATLGAAVRSEIVYGG